jgi:hypothetical protein
MTPEKQPAAAPGGKKGKTMGPGSSSTETRSTAPTPVDVGIRISQRIRIRAEQLVAQEEAGAAANFPTQPPKKKKATKKKPDGESKKEGAAEEGTEEGTEGKIEFGTMTIDQGTMTFEEATTAAEQLPPPLMEVLGNPSFFIQMFVEEGWVPKVCGYCSLSLLSLPSLPPLSPNLALSISLLLVAPPTELLFAHCYIALHSCVLSFPSSYLSSSFPPFIVIR